MRRNDLLRVPARRRHLHSACLVAAGILLLCAGPAAAAQTATFDATSGTLTVTGGAGQDGFTIASSTGDQIVRSSEALNDPDGTGSICAAIAMGVSCKGSAVRSIVIDAGDGEDNLVGTYSLEPIALVRLNGQGGDDILTSNNFFGQIRLDGGPGDDALIAGSGRFASSPFGSGADTATGGPGDDKFFGGDAVDNFAAEPGADTYEGRGPSPSAEGFPPLYPRYTPADTMTYAERTEPVTVALDTESNDGAAGEHDYVDPDIEYVAGGAGNDTMRAGSSAVVLLGSGGDDVMAGGPARDVLAGGDGDDAIDALDANVDHVDCGAGTDRATLDFPIFLPPLADVDRDCDAVDLVGFGVPPGARPVVTPRRTTVSPAAFRRTGSLRLTVGCTQGCVLMGTAYLESAPLRARIGSGPVGSGSLSIGAGQRRMTIRISGAYRAKLNNRLRTKAQRRQGIAFKVRLTATNIRGNVTTATARVKIQG